LFLDDESISYPYATQETVPTWLLIVLTFVLPVVVIIGSSYFFGERKFTRDVYVALLGFVIAYGLTGLFTDIVKVRRTLLSLSLSPKQRRLTVSLCRSRPAATGQTFSIGANGMLPLVPAQATQGSWQRAARAFRLATVHVKRICWSAVCIHMFPMLDSLVVWSGVPVAVPRGQAQHL